jgi:hypothetical protein
MTPVQEKSTSKISAEAFDLLDCFVAGLDDVVYDVAEHTARHRLGKSDPNDPIEITGDDVAIAGETVIRLLREQVSQKVLSDSLGPILDQVERCFTSRRRASSYADRPT